VGSSTSSSLDLPLPVVVVCGRRFGSAPSARPVGWAIGAGGLHGAIKTPTLAVQPAPDARAEPPQTFPLPDSSTQARKPHALRCTPAVTRRCRFAPRFRLSPSEAAAAAGLACRRLPRSDRRAQRALVASGLARIAGEDGRRLEPFGDEVDAKRRTVPQFWWRFRRVRRRGCSRSRGLRGHRRHPGERALTRAFAPSLMSSSA
jgi:hypothetical protein